MDIQLLKGDIPVTRNSPADNDLQTDQDGSGGQNTVETNVGNEEEEKDDDREEVIMEDTKKEGQDADESKVVRDKLAKEETDGSGVTRSKIYQTGHERFTYQSLGNP